eukprot:TRINITY_DN3369_c0_g1_i13.p1 TRINITY_DN3369_c0_g1~~TRINITY_DN3369_c0_g1_i13.p1  ORF type:complete len:373 (+),score=54.27 TRINITY_DN3369_c0_g1_i13:129-1247(+)
MAADEDVALLGGGNIAVANALDADLVPEGWGSCYVYVIGNDSKIVRSIYGESAPFESEWTPHMTAIDGTGGFAYGCEDWNSLAPTLNITLHDNNGQRTDPNTTIQLSGVGSYSPYTRGVFALMTVPGGFAAFTLVDGVNYSFTRFNAQGAVVATRTHLDLGPDFHVDQTWSATLWNGNVVVACFLGIVPPSLSKGKRKHATRMARRPGGTDVDFQMNYRLAVITPDGDVAAKLNISRMVYPGSVGQGEIKLVPRGDVGGFFLAVYGSLTLFGDDLSVLANISTGFDVTAACMGTAADQSDVILGGFTPSFLPVAVSYDTNGSHSAEVPFRVIDPNANWLLRPPNTTTLWNIYALDHGEYYVTGVVQKYDILP